MTSARNTLTTFAKPFIGILVETAENRHLSLFLDTSILTLGDLKKKKKTCRENVYILAFMYTEFGLILIDQVY